MFNPTIDGAILSLEWKDDLWDKFVTAAPRPRYKGMDHHSTWMNPETGKAIHIDEPYINPRGWFAGTFDECGQSWCQANDYEWCRPKWAGIYLPEDWCDFILISHKTLGEPLNAVVRRLEAYHPAVLGWTADFITQAIGAGGLDPPLDQIEARLRTC